MVCTFEGEWPYDESGIIGCIDAKLRENEVVGLHTLSETVVGILREIGTIEFKDNHPFKYYKDNRSYWII